ncbi:MAG: DNA polymerase III subunit beta [Clostridia bacterium]|nr:DNA polymerase III subunit beta [Clostridia bacterium]
MKFYCNGMELSNATNIVSKAVAANKNIPILEGIKLSAQGRTLTMSAFNQEIFIEKTIIADVYEEGEVIVNGKMFNDCANKISSIDKVCVEQGLNNKLTITFGKSSMELNYFEANGFAELGAYNDENCVKIKEKDLKELFERCIFCVSTGNESRIILKSCSIIVKDGVMEALCLDGFRLAISRKEVKDYSGNVKCVVLGKIISDVVKILGDSEEKVKVINEKKSLIIDLGHTKISTTLVESEFFNYQNILPKNMTYEVIVNKADLEGSLNRAAIISRETHNNGIYLTIDSNKINIFSENEKGKTNENIDCKFDGEEVKIGVNNRFLSDAIARIKEDYVKIIIEDSRKPILVKRIDGDDYMCIILPIRMIG